MPPSGPGALPSGWANLTGNGLLQAWTAALFAGDLLPFATLTGPSYTEITWYTSINGYPIPPSYAGW